MKMINGIELLKKIKNNELKLNQKINVYYDNKDVAYDLVAILTYKGNEVIWSENTFRFSMLYDDNYLFEIIEEKTIQENISKLSYQQIGTYQLDNNDILGFIKALNEQFTKHGRKINEIVDYINKEEVDKR